MHVTDAELHRALLPELHDKLGGARASRTGLSLRDDTSLAGGRVSASSRRCGYQYATRGQKAAKGSECADVGRGSWWA